ncbi:Zn finger protein HypA/HybF involved in hydrogenase expression [Lactovum miscens]|uniref:Zn finger protein HypA/HybF involved in hydrogenase expression n=1 Tax=Lactovum miscens TaxID=190387 RepID=A0A841C843_9LACT|nr:Zn finger protein HypA/HybF involved in hydrogenase expression [Lactovum miscens]
MSYYNHMNDQPDKRLKCSSCGKPFNYTISDGSMSGEHDWAPIVCPWCGSHNGKVHGGATISVWTSKIE